VRHICHLVNGMPLAILLAAAWLEVLSLAKIAAEIERTYEFLEIDLQDMPTRHRSMRAVFEQSWNLLGASERQVFAALSVFRGGFTEEAALQVADAALKDIFSLLRKSLLRRVRGERFTIHELLR